MWKSNSCKGYVLIEVLCSIVIFMVLFNFIMLTLKNNYRLQNENEKKEQYICFIDALTKEITKNWNFEYVKSMEEKQGCYIPKEYMSIDLLKQCEPDKIISYENPQSEPYVKIDVSGSDILTINIKLYYSILNNNRMLNITCLKGRYL